MYSEIITDFDYVAFFKETIASFGGVSRSTPKYVLRKNVNNPFPESGAYFGCINEGEENTGIYSDLSIVVFPSNEPNKNDDRWIIALGVGSQGFKNDYHLVSLPGTRRSFMNCLGNGSFIKNDFMDIETQDGFTSFCERQSIPETLKNAVKNYSKVLLACTIFDPNNVNEGKKVIKLYLALYAKMRNWPTNNSQKREINTIIQDGRTVPVDEEDEIKKLLDVRKYIVLQGAPGTGKTRMAKRIVGEQGQVFFTQFHAETSYSDFVYGIVPDIHAADLKYSEREGIFVKAIKAALNSNEKKVFLIIDEINRANLSNVLGPAFYLFEPTMSSSNIKIEINPGLSLEKLPDNLYVIATMNTADRSLAVVDFALRRRFAWYTLYPHVIKTDSGKVFRDKEFNEIAAIFERYATDEELNLQPGHAYFIVSDKNPDDEIKTRLKYEIMPLIKEYLIDGMLLRAKDDFVNYFREEIGEEMYR
jgi:5-methylcytosine-specific restriction protein B